MVVDLVMPKMGESIMEGTILKWHKKPGDKVERDETVLEISTDKVDTEVPSPESGVISEIMFNEGDVVQVGNVIAKINTNGSASATEVIEKKSEPKEEAPKETPKETPQQASKEVDTLVEEPESAKLSGTSDRFYSPLVMNIARKEGIGFEELERIPGTGAGGRVSKKDILAYLENRKSGKTQATQPVQAQKPATQPVQTTSQPAAKPQATQVRKPELPKYEVDYNEEGLSVMEFDNIRQKMAEHMVVSMAISPHVNAIAECDLSAVDKARKEMNKDFPEKEGFKMTYMPFIAEATVKALKDFPLINSIIDDTSAPFKAIMRNKINLGMAVAMDNGGLIVPIIKNADGKNLVGLARDISDLGKRAKVKKLTLDEIQGGTFTISNYGVFGNIIGTMIINQPQVAILGVGAVKKRPAVLETEQGDFVVIKPMVYLSLSFDHRLIDGALGGQFLMRIVHYLENYNS
ncbi:MAG TPA: dihydrolipoamide acetyltransferase family protein [Ignavibacteria bacterium]|nr:dihydrolipoamide acetyltransferase family protein [Ignavibacteria bacterium]